MTISIATLTSDIQTKLKALMSSNDVSLEANTLALAAAIAAAVSADADTGYLSAATPLSATDGAAAVGTGVKLSREDHVHHLKFADKVALTDANATLDVGTGTWFYLPAATLTAGRTLTLSPTVGTPAAGDTITITRLDTSANTLAIVDGGAGTPTLITLPVSKIGSVVCQFDGTHWFLKSCPQQ